MFGVSLYRRLRLFFHLKLTNSSITLTIYLKDRAKYLLTNNYKVLRPCKLKPQENQSSPEIMPKKQQLFLTMQDSSEREERNIYRLAIVLLEQIESQTQTELRTLD